MNEILLWRVAWGRISPKPVRAIDLGDGYIKVVGSCLIRQKRDERRESYHDTHEQAIARFLSDAERELDRAKKDLVSAQRHLKSAKVKAQTLRAQTQP